MIYYNHHGRLYSDILFTFIALRMTENITLLNVSAHEGDAQLRNRNHQNASIYYF